MIFYIYVPEIASPRWMRIPGLSFPNEWLIFKSYNSIKKRIKRKAWMKFPVHDIPVYKAVKNILIPARPLKIWVWIGVRRFGD